MSIVLYYIAEGLKKLKEELDYLKSVMRLKASVDIVEVRDKGDLSENAEYDAAKEAQGLLEHKISQMQQILGNARVIDESQMDISKVMVLNKVKVKNHKTNAVVNYQLVSEKEADLKTGKISVKSPIGIALLGKVVGEKVDVTVPAGVISLEILEISI